MSDGDDLGARVSEKMTAILAEIPTRLNIRGILVDAHRQLSEVCPGPPEFLAMKIAEVLHEIANHAVEEYTDRTGQPFQWVDDPELPAQDDTFMSFALDAKGHVIFDNDPPQPPADEPDEP